MENNIINTIKDGERVTSTYAETYFGDDYCDYKNASSTNKLKEKINAKIQELPSEWVSPSDLLIGVINLKPPFTSKITRGKTHEGILGIGDQVLENERKKFVKYITTLILENEAAWQYLLEHERSSVTKKVKVIYDKIFMDKSNIMTKEISIFYEKSLHELEAHLKTQVQKVLISTNASIISQLNTDIKEKLKTEKNVLEEVLKQKYGSELAKVKSYYKWLLNNELLRHNILINKAITGRNDVLKAFYRQFEAENTTSTMYVMCTERKKCRIKQFILDNYQTLELKEKYKRIKEREDVIEMFKEREVNMSQLNKEWEDKIHNILRLFLKFISFSLKLLPEQSSFLLNFEKMVVLQLNEMQKMPDSKTSVLVNADKLYNVFKFDHRKLKEEKCTKEPFVIEGDLARTPPPVHGSRETLPDDVDLPVVKLKSADSELIYAKCHHYEEIKTLLEARRCKCLDDKTKQSSSEPDSSTSDQSVEKEASASIKSESTYEDLLMEDIHRLNKCPAMNCQDWYKRNTFPDLNSYLHFDDEKYQRVKTILGNSPQNGPLSKFIDPKDFIFKELPFAQTKETYHSVGTQYSSQEDLYIPGINCPCTDTVSKSHGTAVDNSSKIVAANIKRKESLRYILQENPNLLKMFTDESIDF